VARQLPLEDEGLLTPRHIYGELDRFVIGQERAKRAVAIAAYNHQKRVAQRREGGATLLRKSNILLVGPTGSGKTHIARQLARILSVPFTVVDATEYTEAGYYGKDVEVMIGELLLRAGHDVELAQRGIVFVDEIDKIARRSQGARNGAGSRDIGGEGVQQSLLKLLEGREVFVPLNVTQHWSKHDFVQVDTTDILFVCAGTFTDLHTGAAERRVGFGAHGASQGSRRIEPRDLTEYGMLAELLGRLPVVVQLEELSERELYHVLTGPPDALVREYRELLAHEEIDLHFTEGALREVVRFAIARGVGARGLRGILEEVMADVMFHAPERRRERVQVDARYVARKLAALRPARNAGG
jgi:ATP-dependent Clp protease ATP-binding subunit ClpX